jgi:serine/threonine protein kinase
MLAKGTVLRKRYKIIRPLGQGGMGQLYVAQDLRLKRRCAVKECVPESAGEARQFAREARILAHLKHPNLPRVFDHFEDNDNRHYLAMDLIPGEDLAAMLHKRRRPFPERQVLEWADQLLGALQYLHCQDPPIIHRDIKPSNVKITPDGQAVLIDFGLAKMLKLGKITTSGADGLTYNYAPKEQYQKNGTTDARSDLYSLGVTLYELLTNERPPASLDRALNNTPVTPIRQLNGRVSPNTERVIKRAIALEPKDRYQKARTFRHYLLSPSARKRTPRTAQVAAQTRRRKAQQRRRALILSGAVATVVLIAAIAWGLLAGHPGDLVTRWRGTPLPAPITTDVTTGPASSPPGPSRLYLPITLRNCQGGK